ncbi:hypothetical protein M501DRAFT_930984 [Patellaria atrata CBS 101060]|uniref:Uncharacterized protein n=1 Tax=Patellaria atrata CBS 101060 TaxID=1346257 RepID=A0A9P4SDR0_9PEZI|nr:hypothetical protein M501DRAFT_930984 [Patellaria atrata CBS 101060]
MFSPDATIHSGHTNSLRNPRRRQRNDSEGVRHPRKRSKISSETFSPSPDKIPNGNGFLGVNGHARNENRAESVSLREVPVREKKLNGVGKRATKGDGSIVLTQNPHYSVRQLPSIPDQLEAESTPYRGSSLPFSNLALALTFNKAFIWDYTLPTTSPTTRTVDLPYSTRLTEPLPLGSLVTSGPSREVGLVVVFPSTGHIKFWEDVDNVASLNLLKNHRGGLDSKVHLPDKATITEIIDAGHAGFILLLSNGQLAQLMVRDSQGRSNINVDFLPFDGTSANNGLFSISGFGKIFRVHKCKHDIAAAKVRPSTTKGQMEVVATSSSGLFKIWNINWSGQHALDFEVDAHEEIAAAVYSDLDHDSSHNSTIKVIDFAFLPEPFGTISDVARQKSKRTIQTLALVSVANTSSLRYSLVEVDLHSGGSDIRRAFPLDSYRSSITNHDCKVPKLLLPHPGHTVTIVFEDAVVLASLQIKESSPESQLLADSGELQSPYQDCFYLNIKDGFSLQGHEIEDRTGKDTLSQCILFSYPAGIVRITTLDPEKFDNGTDTARVTAKSKIEQVVFFSGVPGQIIDFSRKPELQFSNDEVELAALHVSKDILRSNSETFQAMAFNMDRQLSMRAQSLHLLAVYISANYPSISHSCKWKLLRDAEKLASVRKVWKYHDRNLQNETPQQRLLLPEWLEIVHGRHKTEARVEIGELDLVRQWFTRDVSRWESLVPSAYAYLQVNCKGGGFALADLLHQALETVEIVYGSLHAALEFRELHAENYGLIGEDFENGILRSNYEGLPEFWTSSHNLVNTTRTLVKLVSQQIGRPDDDIDDTLNAEVAQSLPKLARLCCVLNIERYTWYLHQDDAEKRVIGERIKREFDTVVQHELLTALNLADQQEQGIEIAEWLRNMTELVNLISTQFNMLFDTVRDFGDREGQYKSMADNQLDIAKERLQHFFNKYGNDFATPYFLRYLETKQPALIFNPSMSNSQYRKEFLQADPSRAKLRWINEVIVEKNPHEAANALLTVAETQETNIWCKKVELSIAKLSLLAADKIAALQRNSTELKLTTLQNKLYNHISLTVLESLDQDSALDLVMGTYAAKRVHRRPGVRQVIRLGFELLINQRVLDADMLIDILTLMDHEKSQSSADDISGQQFYLALDVLATSKSSKSPFIYESLQKLIWKRCYFMDDWNTINKTEGKSDEHVGRVLQKTVLFRTLKACAKATLLKGAPHVIPIPPSECVSAGCSPQELIHRFPSEDMHHHVMSDNAKDGEQLTKYIEHARLDEWVKACDDLAIQIVNKEGDDEAEEKRLEQEGVLGWKEKPSTDWVLEEEDDERVTGARSAATSTFNGDDEAEGSGEQSDTEMGGM